jgi:hypothetical protein
MTVLHGVAVLSAPDRTEYKAPIMGLPVPHLPQESAAASRAPGSIPVAAFRDIFGRAEHFDSEAS